MNLNFKTSGKGFPFFFQHGLGGNLSQPLDLMSGLERFQIISMDSRGHGETTFTKPEDISFNQFADDVIALADSMGIEKAVFGGISMGAGISMNIAARYPERVRALVLVRPAWLNKPSPANLEVLKHLGELMKQNKGESIVSTSLFQEINKVSKAAGQAVTGQLNRQQGEHTADILIRMVTDAPVVNMIDLKKFKAPVLVLATHKDPMHSYEFGSIIAESYAKAIFTEITPRYENPLQHKEDVLHHTKIFLRNYNF